MIERLALRFLRLLPAEVAHELALWGLARVSPASWLRRRLAVRYRVEDARLRQRVLGFKVDSVVGVAAGFDKNGVAVEGLAALGFGFVEVGTVTPRAQRGNPRPRLFRLVEQKSLRNALGFNNRGSEQLKRRLEGWRPASVPIGVNLGKNRDTPLERAGDDYHRLVEALNGLADYFVVNLSSPNTPGLRELQSEAFVGRLVADLAAASHAPLALKISPDLSQGEATALSAVAVEAGARAIIVANTSTDYALVPGVEARGGLSGAVLREKSYAMLESVARELYPHAVLVSVGGVDSAAEAYRRLRAGASLVELYTALVYEGPRVARSINRGLLELLERDGMGHIEELIGADRR